MRYALAPESKGFPVDEEDHLQGNERVFECEDG